ncbi:N-acyl homoserine lactonase family protein [Gemmatimonas sp.]|uniref:N-acyl homoserine lactonase family protein n=1 Tax=Gemmatimonas sp. TaxID=1962908 RepID=UPI00398336E2
MLTTFARFTRAARAALLVVCSAWGPIAARGSAQGAPEIYAVRYGAVANMPVSSLIAGADTARRLDVALTVWVIKPGNDRIVLVDAGFYREKFIARWKPVDYQKPSDAIRVLGITPEQVTDIIVSHVHWDHVDGIDLFPNATVWIQREEYEHHVGDGGVSLDRAADALDAAMLYALRQAGRVQLVDGDAQDIMPGIRVYTGGKHTFASQYAGVQTARGTVVLASDNAYLYENLDTRTPIAQTLDRAANLAAQQRMLELAGTTGVVVPGHDPAVFTRFPVVGKGAVRIR